MAFVLKQSDTYRWPVEGKSASGTGSGQTSPIKFEGEFRRLKQSRVDEIMAAAKAGETQDDDVCREILCGWSGISDDDGSELSFSDAALTRVLDVVGVRTAVLEAFFDSITGAKRKN